MDNAGNPDVLWCPARLVVTDRDQMDLVGDLAEETNAFGIPGQVQGVNNRRTAADGTEGRAYDGSVVMDDVERVAMQVPVDAVNSFDDSVAELRRRGFFVHGFQPGRGLRAASGQQGHVVSSVGQIFGQDLHDPLDATIRAGRHRKPWRCELQDSHRPPGSRHEPGRLPQPYRESDSPEQGMWNLLPHHDFHVRRHLEDLDACAMGSKREPALADPQLRECHLYVRGELW